MRNSSEKETPFEMDWKSFLLFEMDWKSFLLSCGRQIWKFLLNWHTKLPFVILTTAVKMFVAVVFRIKDRSKSTRNVNTDFLNWTARCSTAHGIAKSSYGVHNTPRIIELTENCDPIVEAHRSPESRGCCEKSIHRPCSTVNDGMLPWPCKNILLDRRCIITS